MDPRIILVGEEGAGGRLLQALHQRGVPIVAVLSDGPVGTRASKMAYPVLPARRVTDPGLADELGEVDLLLNAHSLHRIVPRVLELPRVGAFNVHPGPLPEYAGLNVPSWAIYNGESTHGVTVHWMTPEIDAGPVALAESFELSGEETGLTLGLRCARLGVELVLRLVEMVAEGRTPPRRAQDLSRRRYYSGGSPRQGPMTSDMEADEIERLSRASDFGPFPSPWGEPRVEIDGRPRPVRGVRILHRPCHAPPGTAVVEGDGIYRLAVRNAWIELRLGGSSPVRSAAATS